MRARRPMPSVVCEGFSILLVQPGRFHVYVRDGSSCPNIGHPGVRTSHNTSCGARSLAASLIAQAPVTRSDLVVEIGPGRGILTRELARRCREVVAVEFDGALSEALRTRFLSDDRVMIVSSDFLRFRLPDVPYKVLGNIPFNRTAEIVRRLVQADSPPQDAWLVIQREAAERFAGSPELLRSRRPLNQAVSAIRIHANANPTAESRSRVRSFRTTPRPHLRPVARIVQVLEADAIVRADGASAH